VQPYPELNSEVAYGCRLASAGRSTVRPIEKKLSVHGSDAA
jgi:hypothetical protein